MHPATLLLLVTAGVLGAATGLREVHASPMEDTSLGGAVFTGPTSGHASSFFVNPAALGLAGTGSHVHLGGSGQLDSIFVDQVEVSPDGSQSDGDSLSNHTLTPGGIIAINKSFEDDDGHFGVALYTPTIQRFAAGDPRLGYHSEGGQISQGMVTFAGAYRFGGRLLVGLGVSLGYSSIQLKFSRDTALDGGSDSQTGTSSDCSGSPCGFENEETREHYDVTVGNPITLSSLFTLRNISASIGVAYKLPGDRIIGLGYVALPGALGRLSLSGTAAITASPRDGGETTEATAEVGFRMAQMVFLGYRQPLLPDFDLVTDLRWQDWSRHDQFDIRLFGGNLAPQTPEWMPRYRGMHDVWRLSAGIESNDRQRHRFGARLRLESSATDAEATNALLVGGANVTLATGTEIRVADQWVVGLGYELGWTPTIDATSSDFSPVSAVACVDSQYSFDECSAARDGRALATAAGRYQQLRHGMVLSLRYDSL